MSSRRITSPVDHRAAVRARALVFEDPRSRDLLQRIEQIAPTDATVLVTGETGTGKELVARFLHERSRRADGPFIAVNCGALSPSLLESELFGHEKGAFTGALATQPGWFEAANGGTLFLDEIGDLPLDAQVKLLRVLQEHEVVRVGSRRTIPIDVRLVAATHADLERSVASGKFREDLFYRLHVAPLHLLPLRERRGDILPLAHHFLRQQIVQLGLESYELTADAEQRLVSHRFPGNIRELENATHHALVVSRDGRITSAELRFSTRTPPPPPPAARTEPKSGLREALVSLLEEEKPNLHEHIEEVVFRTAYEFAEKNQLRTARLLGISRNIVRARLLQFGLISGGTRGGEDTRTIRVGHYKFGALGILRATRALEEAFASQRVRVEWIEYANGTAVVDALVAGTIDVGGAAEAAPIIAQATRAPIAYLAAEPPAPEGKAIVVHPESPAASVADLGGRVLALSRGPNVHYFVLRALEEAGLTEADVELRFLPPQVARAAFEAREVDAWAIWNPVLESLRQSRAARVLRDARGLAPNRSFYVGRAEFVEQNQELVRLFLEKVQAIGRWANESPDTAAHALAAQLDVAEPAVRAALAGTHFELSPIDADVVASQQRTADGLLHFKLIGRPVRVADAVWPLGEVRRSA